MGYDAYVTVRGIRSPDAEWQKMKAVWDSCKDAGVDVPDDVGKFFDHDPPHEEGICVGVKKEVGHCDDERMTIGVRNGAQGSYYLIELASLPTNITHLKVWLDESY